MRVRIADQEDIPQLLQLYLHPGPDDKEITTGPARETWALPKLYPG